MPNLILDLMVDRVDLVDEGANAAAHIKLYKRKENDNVMNFDEILAKMKPEHKAVIESEIAKAKSEVPEETQEEMDKLKKDNEDLNEEVAKAKSELEDIAKSKGNDEPDFEEVLKSLDPTVQEVFKSMKAQKDAAEAVARQAAEEKITQEAVAKAKELKSLPVEEAKLVDIMKGITPEVFDVLKAASKALEDGGLLDEVGKARGQAAENNSGNADDAWAKIEKAADQIAADEKITKAKAITKAIKQNPELYREYLAGGAN